MPMSNLRISALLLALSCAIPTLSAPATVLRDHGDFDSRSLLGGRGERGESLSGLSFSNPSRFSMQQSYSLSAMSGGGGSASSGLYLNTVSYRITDPLVLSVDMGIYTPLYSSYGSSYGGYAGKTGAESSSFVLPRIGLEYAPNDRFSLQLQVVNAQDAWKAYGGYPSYFGSRFPYLRISASSPRAPRAPGIRFAPKARPALFTRLLFAGLCLASFAGLTACEKSKPQAFKPNTGQIQVLNGSGKSGMADVFRNFLADYGFDIIEFGNAREWNYERTVVISRSAASDQIARDLAKVLGTDRVIHLQHSASLVEATVIIGKDYKELMRSWPQPEKK